jgi:8-amino-7-oxononanoate synthase
LSIDEHTPEALTRAYFAAVGSGDRAALTAVMSPAVQYRFPGSSPFAGIYDGRDQVLAYLDRLRAFTNSSMNVTVRDVMIGTDHCAGSVRAEAHRDGITFAWNLVALITCSPTAIESIALYYDDQSGVDQFLAEAD